MPTPLLIGALSGWQHTARRTACRSTWMTQFPHQATPMFLLGTGATHAPKLHFDYLLLPVPPTYPELPQRTRAFCQFALTLPHWQYLFKCDDDTYIHIPRLLTAALQQYDPTHHHYIGVEWKPGVAYCSGGAGYLLSRKATAIVAESLDRLVGAEDAEVGRVLRYRANIHMTHDHRFIPWHQPNETHRPTPTNAIITTHAVSPTLMQSLHTLNFPATATSISPTGP